MSLGDAGLTVAFDLSPYARQVRAIWVEGVGEVQVKRVQIMRRPWWVWWDLRAETELWRLPDGRLVRAQRQTLESWTFDGAEEGQVASRVHPAAQVNPSPS